MKCLFLSCILSSLQIGVMILFPSHFVFPTALQVELSIEDISWPKVVIMLNEDFNVGVPGVNILTLCRLPRKVLWGHSEILYIILWQNGTIWDDSTHVFFARCRVQSKLQEL